ncbi:hypothetical protein HUZ36_19920 [Pseudoalteromonas sp. McH1-7]|nr:MULTISPECIES: hypothetical protein [Pseudoalteromonas]MDW7551491.1 hypothetical protein [Pseudoalteromonas peptidolytica]NLR16850.1 hypothetical protein [Pseudoalteromonas peptidolytica]NUZ13049.1 hypothetical protein [Pseudoalteromonas sp. McH1-7]RRS07240.1 hypothetical protein EAG18_17885 [Pseudoalteromonas sp. J010]RXE98117.1 hypothetical protein D9603_17425 [Pseudoalteromonas sp. PS5]
MKKFLVLAIIVVALFTVDHPLIKEPRERLLGQGVNTLSESSKIQRSTAARIARANVAKAITMTEDEKAYINEALASDEKVRLFHLKYCKENDYNLYFYGSDLITICEIASQAIQEAEGL